MNGRHEEVSNDELERELTIAASAIGRFRFDKFEELLAEARSRGLVLTVEDIAPSPARPAPFRP